jgi:hypothetical protein
VSLLKLVAGVWTFLGNKHAGEPVDKVAESDPGYLSWAWRESSGDESDEEFHILDDVARKHGVDTAKGVRIDNNSFRKQRITHDRSRKRK